MSVTITEKAANELKRVLSEGSYPTETLLRVGISAGGCSGFQYDFRFTPTEEIDASQAFISDQHGLKVAVDKRSEMFLDGTVIDWYESIERRGFTFSNPNVQRSCGCGSSFSV